jgi:ABC-type nitrate/sulfonate/bicarbonate transport system permease component
MKPMPSWIRKGWPPVLAVILLLFGWQAATAWTGIPKWILPSPSDIVKEGIANFPRIWMHTAFTLRITLIGFAVGVASGFALAVLMHWVPVLKTGFYPLLILSQNIHPAALGPLLMIWFGFGLTPKIIVITLVCFFPVIVAMLDGLTQTDRAMLDYMRMIGASKRQTFWKLELPHALPSLFSGLKLSATYSVMGAVIAEWLGADKGIGVYIQMSRASFLTTRVFVAIVVIVVLSVLLFGIIALLESLVIRWKPRK